jgi:hypothetical protein
LYLIVELPLKVYRNQEEKISFDFFRGGVRGGVGLGEARNAHCRLHLGSIVAIGLAT